MDPYEITQEIDPKQNEDFFSLNGFLYFSKKKYILPELFKYIGKTLTNVKVRDDDVWIAGFPRSGTHWLAELTWLLCNNLDFDKAISVLHDDRVPYFDINERALKIVDNNITEINAEAVNTYFESLSSPRCFKTHLPLTLLPPYLLNTSKMIYIARDPRDVVVSSYYYYKIQRGLEFNGNLKTMLDQFQEDYITFGPYFSNVLEFWAEKNNENLLFLFYEELYDDLPATVRRVANFLGRDYTENEFASLCKHLSFKNMKKNKSIYEVKLFGDANQEVLRKGKAGGWEQEFDKEMMSQAADWISEKLKGTDFKYPHMQLKPNIKI